MKPENLNFTFTVQEVEIILTALNELPRKLSQKLFVKIDSEAVRQLEEKEENVKILNPNNNKNGTNS